MVTRIPAKPKLAAVLPLPTPDLPRLDAPALGMPTLDVRRLLAGLLSDGFTGPEGAAAHRAERLLAALAAAGLTVGPGSVGQLAS